MLRTLLHQVLSKTPGLAGVYRERDQLLKDLTNLRSSMQFEPGHFYSPVSSKQDIERHFNRLRQKKSTELPGIDLNIHEQRAVRDIIAKFYSEQPFSAKETPGLRYYFDNQTFVWSDAIFLYGMMRHMRPKRVVEVGSGFSSAVMLDTSERFLAGETKLTFIEPYPERLHSLMNDQDKSLCRIIDTPIQDVLDEPWNELESGDILFIDSSHVSKCGSDVNQLIFDLLPSLAPGVIVHIHDVFPQFEYPMAWHQSGRSWNEDYLLRAFLQFNSAFSIMLWVPFIIEDDREYFQRNMPFCLNNTGGSIWIRKLN